MNTNEGVWALAALYAAKTLWEQVQLRRAAAGNGNGNGNGKPARCSAEVLVILEAQTRILERQQGEHERLGRVLAAIAQKEGVIVG